MATIMFKKPKRNFRKKVSDVGSDEERGQGDGVDMETGDAFTPSIKPPQEKKKKSKNKESSKSSVLSFQIDEDNDEGDAEIFKVKKSSHSRRIAKQLKKEKEREEKESKNGNSIDGHISDEDQNNECRHSRSKRNESETRRRRKDAEEEERLAEEKLKQLREEFRTLNGEEAEALDDSDDEDEQKAFKNRLARGEIPDAKTIHFIRKQRQMARETDNFIPIEEEKVKATKSTARLVRDDDNDKSDEDDDPHRIEFSVNQAARERQQIRDDFLAAEQGSDEDSDQEREWEKQQIQKAVSYQIPGVQIPSEINNGTSEVNFVSSSEPNVRSQDVSMDVKPFSALNMSKDMSEFTIEVVRKRLEERLSIMESVYRTHNIELNQTLSDLTATEENEVSCRKKAPKLENQYRFFQELRGYVQDLVECLNEKVPIIQDLEHRINNIFKSRALRLVQRRQQDIKDQCRDYMTSKGSVRMDTEVVEQPARQRRTADREARRARRRRVREGKNIQGHHDGLSSDEEESSQSQVLKFQSEIDEIHEAQTHLFSDVVEEFSQMEAVKNHFEDWKFTYQDSYKEAYIGLCAPKLLNPFIRKELLLWNPLDENCSDFEEKPWYNLLVFMGFREEEEMDRSDDDYKILPSILEKTILPKLSFLVEHVWDPLSTTQTARLVNLTLRLTKDYPNIHAKNKNFKILLECVVNRLQRTLDDDIFMPMYPLSALDNRSSGPAVFFHRQSWTCIKLLGNILSWHKLIAEPVLQKLAFSGLLNRYIVLSLVSSHINKEALQKCQSIISTFPKEWFEKLEGDATLPQLENLCRYLVSAAETLHKATALEQDKERLGGRELVKQISKHLVNIHAMDHAVHLANQFSFPLNA